MSEEEFKLPCGHAPTLGIQYSWDSPEHYDGISEWECGHCNKRFGRWSGKEICAEYPVEFRYGDDKCGYVSCKNKRNHGERHCEKCAAKYRKMTRAIR